MNEMPRERTNVAKWQIFLFARIHYIPLWTQQIYQHRFNQERFCGCVCFAKNYTSNFIVFVLVIVVPSANKVLIKPARNVFSRSDIKNIVPHGRQKNVTVSFVTDRFLSVHFALPAAAVAQSAQSGLPYFLLVLSATCAALIPYASVMGLPQSAQINSACAVAVCFVCFGA